MDLHGPVFLLLGAAFGLAYGFLLQRGDFCFTSAFRDLYAFRHTRVLQGIVTAVAVTTLGWGIALSAGWATPDRLWVPPVGWNSLLGGFLFGIAMYVAGGCASGTLYRAGMGYGQFWITLLGMGAGYYAFLRLFPTVLQPHFFKPLQIAGPVTLYRLLPWPPLLTALLAVAVLLAGVALVAGPGAIRRSLAELAGFFRQGPGVLLRLRSWDTRAVGLLLGLVSTLQFSLWTIWGITGPETRWVAVAWAAVDDPARVAANPYVASLFRGYPGLVPGPEEVLIAGIIAGAALSARLNGTFRWRRPRLRRLPNAVAGGFLLAFASRLTPGCNIGNLLSGLPALSLHSLLASAGIAAGIYTAWKIAHLRQAALLSSCRVEPATAGTGTGTPAKPAAAPPAGI
ncbi:YeeE/YedE family protein [Thermaerobacter subterraneus]|uniref:Transporter component n=1 Tax=Thermaerobacter subterraneus DSM 13965 TaxID=867903 RepID=K6Q3A7_9FIRM|nr:YeeE/YedE family protein [Thermaerobacter subterraneus]EKP95763.1 putative transporter component [Thermaerobacter subterraneus DSM 13965]